MQSKNAEDREYIWEAVAKEYIIVTAESCSSKIDTIIKFMDVDSVLFKKTNTTKLDTFYTVTFCVKNRIQGQFHDSSFSVMLFKCNLAESGYWIFDPKNINRPKAFVNKEDYIKVNKISVENSIILLKAYLNKTLPPKLNSNEKKLINYIKTINTN